MTLVRRSSQRAAAHDHDEQSWVVPSAQQPHQDSGIVSVQRAVHLSDAQDPHPHGVSKEVAQRQARRGSIVNEVVIVMCHESLEKTP